MLSVYPDQRGAPGVRFLDFAKDSSVTELFLLFDHSTLVVLTSDRKY